MNPKRVILTAWRVLMQLRHDPRTIAMVLLLPSLLSLVLYYAFINEKNVFAALAPQFLGIFPFVIMFIVTSVATLRERTAGTLERLMTMPLRPVEFVIGYAAAFGLAAFLQASLATLVVTGCLGVSVAGGSARLLLLAVASGIIGEALGLFVSAFAATEFQAVQFMPALVIPQLLTCGLFVDRASMAKGLQWFADIMPLTYIVDAAKKIATEADWSHPLTQDLLVIIVYAVVILCVSAVSLRADN